MATKKTITDNETLTETQTKKFMDGIEWFFWDKKNSLSLCNRLLDLAMSTPLDLDQKDQEAISLILSLQNAILDVM